jgi:thiamine-phosphate diphosphorylase
MILKISFSDNRPVYYYITNRAGLSGLPLISSIHRAIKCGVDFIQIREKDLSDQALFDLTHRAVVLAGNSKCRILVNGRADVAFAAGAHGVHLPSTGLQVCDVRKMFPLEFLIGISVHSLPEIRRACAQGVDYILMGHVFPTESKIGMGQPTGLKMLRKACSISTVPVLGLGGISLEKIDAVLNAGAAGIAAITLFQNKIQFAAFKRRLK